MENNKITLFLLLYFFIKKGESWIPDKEKMLFRILKKYRTEVLILFKVLHKHMETACISLK